LFTTSITIIIIIIFFNPGTQFPGNEKIKLIIIIIIIHEAHAIVYNVKMTTEKTKSTVVVTRKHSLEVAPTTFTMYFRSTYDPGVQT